MLDMLLRVGQESGFAVVEAFGEKIRRQEFAGVGQPASHHDVQCDRVKLRLFRESGDPLCAQLSEPDARQARRCFSELAAGAGLDRKKNFSHLLPKEAAKTRVSLYDPGIELWDETQASDLRERLREALVAFPGLQLKTFQYVRALRKVYLANSRGFFAKYRQTRFQVQAAFMLRGHVLELVESRSHFRDFDPQRLVARGANLLGALAGDADAEPPGEYALMAPEAAAQVLREFSPALRIDGGERLRPGPVAAQRLSIVDNPLLDGQPGSAPFDDEGTTGRETYLVNKGVAVGAVSDIRSAWERGVAGAGNGFRDERGIAPQPRFSNLFIKPSGESLTRLLQQARSGALVCLVKPLGTGPAPGERRFMAYGYAIAGGEVGAPVRFPVLTSVRSYWLHVAAVSRELRFFHGRANVGSPYIVLQGRPAGGAFRI